MADAILAVTALLLPWLALYLAAGIVLGPAILVVANLRHGLRVADQVSDTVTAIYAWPAVGAYLALAEIRVYEERRWHR